MAFATIGLWLLYLANRYNMLFVYDVKVDTKGLVYPRALQQVTTGIYLAVFCLIGLFGIAQAPGPAVLMVVFLIASILFHVSLNGAIGPLLACLPLSLEVEEQSLLSIENGNTGLDHETGYKNGGVSATSDTAGTKALPSAPHKKPNFFSKWLHPEKHTDYHTLRRLVPKSFADILYSPEVERNAFYHPAVASEPPLLWIPRDPMGVSRQEVRHTSHVIPISDEDADFDDKGKIRWNPDTRPPIYEEKIYY